MGDGVKRIGRYVFNTFAALSLALFLACAAIRLVGREEGVQFGRCSAFSDRATLQFAYSRLIWPPRPDWEYRALGARVAAVTLPSGGSRLYHVRVPFGIALAGTAALPVAWLLVRVIHRRRRAPDKHGFEVRLAELRS